MADIPGQETNYEREDEYKEEERQENNENNDRTQQRPDNLLNNDPNKSYENTTFDPPLELPEREELDPGQTEQSSSNTFDEEVNKQIKFDIFLTFQLAQKMTWKVLKM